MASTDTLRQSWRAWLGGDDRRGDPWWVSYVWTLVFAALCAVGFTVVNVAANSSEQAASLPVWYHWFQINLAASLVITLTIRLLFTVSGAAIGRDRLAAWSGGRRSLYFSLVPIVGVSISWPLAALWFLGIDVRREFSFARPGPIVASVGLGLVITFVFVQFFAAKARELQAENRASEARLRLLQGQMQPHFLFNTLANVVSLMETDTARAKLMLESFVDYLRASLSGLGEARHTLADELALVETYLRIIQIRMEERLRYSIEVPVALRGCKLLPLTLQPLVENAVVHGLEPSLAGGSLHIGARREGDDLILTVEDDGRGLPEPGPPAAAAPAAAKPGSAGTALANIGERLRNAYGRAASLRLDALPQGARASLRIPLIG